MNDYDQPFCIIGSKGKFHPSYRFYLPALEPHIEETSQEPQYIVRGLTSKERDEFNQLKAHILFLENKLNTFLLDKKRKKGKY